MLATNTQKSLGRFQNTQLMRVSLFIHAKSYTTNDVTIQNLLQCIEIYELDSA